MRTASTPHPHAFSVPTLVSAFTKPVLPNCQKFGLNTKIGKGYGLKLTS
jgi:hypothetical protein